MRSAQLNAFLPLMENGGGGDHQPWTVGGDDDKNIVNWYRDLVVQHTRLSPYQLTTGSGALEGGYSSLKPLSPKQEAKISGKGVFPTLGFKSPATFSYQLGDNVVVHPVLTAATPKVDGVFNETATVSVDMVFPGGSEEVWLDWKKPFCLEMSQKGGAKVARELTADQYAVYVKQNSMMPLLESKSMGTKVAAWKDLDVNDVNTFSWFKPIFSTDVTKADLREPKESGPGYTARGSWQSEKELTVTVSAHSGPVAVSIVGVLVGNPLPSYTVSFNGAKCTTVEDKALKSIDVVCGDISHGVSINFKFI
jgi:hypothetical protein